MNQGIFRNAQSPGVRQTKWRRPHATLLLTMGLVLSLSARAGLSATNDLAATLQKGLFEEEANHNFSGAIQLYQTLITQFDKDRKLAATAVFRLGECYRKQGKTNEATAQFERVLREFGDETQLQTSSRQSLLAMGVTPGSENPQQSKGSRSSIEQQKQLLQQELKLVEHQLDVQKKQMEVGQLGPDALVATEREVLQIKRQILALEPTPKELQSVTISTNADAAAQEPSTAAEAEEVRRIQGMIKDSPDLINARGEAGQTPLYKAASKGQLTVARFLLANGADIQIRDNFDHTPLHAAVSGGHKAMADLLLDHGAQVNAADSDKRTPLHLAVQQGFRNLVELLLARGADVNARDKVGGTPLLDAAARDSRPLAELLLDKGADINAAYNPVNADMGLNALHFAVRSEDILLLKMLLTHKANPNNTRANGMTPLDDTASNGNLPMAKVLLDSGADINHTNQNPSQLGWTALHYATLANRAEFVSFLIRSNADPNAPILSGFTWSARPAGPVIPATPAAIPGRFATSLSGQENDSGYTALMLASVKAFPEVVDALLAGNADPNAKTKKGNFALNLCVASTEPARAKIFESLLQARAETEARDADQMTPLLRIADNLSADLLPILLPRKPDVHAASSEGNTALHFLAMGVGRGNYPPYTGGSPAATPGMAEQLIKAGADVNAQNAAGKTPLEILQGPHQMWNPEILKALETVLRGAGAVADMDSIRLRRPGSNSEVTIFRRGSKDLNRFSLFELLAVHYGYISTAVNPQAGWATYYFQPASWQRSVPAIAKDSFPFPDLEHITIHRIRHVKSTLPVVLSALLGAAARGADCVPFQLEWGDVVDFPEMDHPVSAGWQGLGEEAQKALDKCLTRTITLTVKGQSTNVVLRPIFAITPQNQNGPETCSAMPPKFSLYPVLQSSGLLRTSSDLSRVKVARLEPEKATLTLDCRTADSPGSSLWLQNGDKIEVPERP